VAGSRGNLLRSMEIDADQSAPTGLAEVADRALLFDQREAVGFQQPDQFAELHYYHSCGLAATLTALPQLHYGRSVAGRQDSECQAVGLDELHAAASGAA
jgi:hypothetical protein